MLRLRHDVIAVNLEATIQLLSWFSEDPEGL